MRIKGDIWKDGKFWLVEVPLLDAMTQGRTKRESFEMIADLIETMVDKPNFKVKVIPGKGGHFELYANQLGVLIALLLRRQRQKNGLSLADISRRLGLTSRNAYARYEQGTSVPSIEKLDELLKAVSPERDLVIIQSGIEGTDIAASG